MSAGGTGSGSGLAVIGCCQEPPDSWGGYLELSLRTYGAAPLSIISNWELDRPVRYRRSVATLSRTDQPDNWLRRTLTWPLNPTDDPFADVLQEEGPAWEGATQYIHHENVVISDTVFRQTWNGGFYSWEVTLHDPIPLLDDLNRIMLTVQQNATLDLVPITTDETLVTLGRKRAASGLVWTGSAWRAPSIPGGVGVDQATGSYIYSSRQGRVVGFQFLSTEAHLDVKVMVRRTDPDLLSPLCKYSYRQVSLADASIASQIECQARTSVPGDSLVLPTYSLNQDDYSYLFSGDNREANRSLISGGTRTVLIPPDDTPPSLGVPECCTNPAP